MPRLALVTGASTGIGRACALHLSGLGFNVKGLDDGRLPVPPDHVAALRPASKPHYLNL